MAFETRNPVKLGAATDVIEEAKFRLLLLLRFVVPLLLTVDKQDPSTTEVGDESLLGV